MLGLLRAESHPRLDPTSRSPRVPIPSSGRGLLRPASQLEPVALCSTPHAGFNLTIAVRLGNVKWILRFGLNRS
eukprot:15438500-Alexandrium_andersonii.AAC.1